MLSRAFLAGLIAVLLTGAASRPEWARFEVAAAQGWPDALALCDLTRFLLEHRELEADVILSRDHNTGQFVPLYGPRFMPPNLLYDGDLRRAFFQLQSAGETDRRSVGEARFRLDRDMLRAFRRRNSEQRRFLEDQAETCSALIADVRTRHR